MARWRLTEKHYLKVPGTKWEYTETERVTGRPKRTQFDVPLYINPEDEIDQRQWGQGPDRTEIHVSHAHSANERDIIFEGNPTTGMFPLDDEARALTAIEEKKWGHRATESLEPEAQNQSFTAALLSGLIDKMTDARTAVQAVPQAPGVEELLKSMTAMMAQQTQILSQLAKPAPGVRRLG